MHPQQLYSELENSVNKIYFFIRVFECFWASFLSPGAGASSWFSKSSFSANKTSEIYENSDDISDLLGKSSLKDDGVENIEYDQHGLVTK